MEPKERQRKESLAVQLRSLRQKSDYKCSVAENRRGLESYLKKRAERINRGSNARSN